MVEGMDNTGAGTTIGIDVVGPIGSYTVAIDGGSLVGRADFLDPPGGEERIFFHTEVDPEFGGRGLARQLLGEALGDSIRIGRTVVPVCPFFARHLRDHGDEFIAAGGTYRTPAPADIALVARLARNRF